jgi:hypothetical protein
MEAAVTVGFGHGDIVFKAAVQGFPEPVYQAKEGIAVVHGFTKYAEAEQIVEIARRFVPFTHFKVD